MNCMYCNCLDANGSRFDWRPKGDCYLSLRKISWIMTFSRRFWVWNFVNLTANFKLLLVCDALASSMQRHQYTHLAKKLAVELENSCAAQMSWVYGLRWKSHEYDRWDETESSLLGPFSEIGAWWCDIGPSHFLCVLFTIFVCSFIHVVTQRFVFVKLTYYFQKFKG